MKRILLFVCAMLWGVGLAPEAQLALASGPDTIASDSFARTLNNAWGNADKGGPYSIVGDTANFSVQNSTGSINVPASGQRAAFLASTRTTEANARVRFKTDQLAAGGAQFAALTARRTANGDSYLARLRLVPDGSVQVEVAKQLAGKLTRIGTRSRVPNVTHRAGEYIHLRMLVVGKNPTTIRVRAWADGQAEPGNWQVQVQDTTATLQQAGSMGVQVSVARKVTNGPFRFNFDDLQVTAPQGSTASSIYWGALVQGAASSPANLAAGGVFDTFEKRAQKKMSILHWGEPWKMNNAYMAFQTGYLNAVRNRGSIPMLDWGSFSYGNGVNQANFQLKDIYGGTFDDYITQWAQDAKAWGHPFFLRFEWEMNGNWQFPWSEQLNGNQPGDYIKMWRHVHDIFTKNGATNVTWVWCPNIAGATTRSMKSLYPGDAYVDWTCLDGYNKYTTWLKFNQVFGAQGINWLHNSYAEITGIAPGKPLMLGEVASLEAGDGGTKKAAWIQDMLSTQLPANFPKIKAVVWFNWNDNNSAYTFPIESSQKSINAFAAGISSSYYAPNNFSNLNTSPIPPLK